MLQSLLFSMTILSGASFATDEAATMGYVYGRGRACKIDRDLLNAYEEQAEEQITGMAIDEDDLNEALGAYSSAASDGRRVAEDEVPPLYDCNSIEQYFY